MVSNDNQSTLPQSDQVASDDVEYDEAAGVYRAEFDFHSRRLSDAVVDAVSTAAETDPLDLPPLYSVIDPDALNYLFDPTVGSSSCRDGSIVFSFYNHQISVHSYGAIEILPEENQSSG